MYKTIQYEIRDKVAILTLNRPDTYNAFNNEMSFEFLDALKDVRKNPEVRSVLLTGAGKAFCSGQDLKDVQGKDRSLADSIETRYNPMIRLITGTEKPFLCAMNGVAAGAGASLALACDLVVASETASLLWAFVNIGLVLDSGSSYLLPRLVGRQKAFEISVLGNKIGMEEALRLGLVSRVVPAAELITVATELAATIAAKAPKAVGLIKRMLSRSFESTLDQCLELEKFAQETAGATEDYKEGVSAFIEKRPAAFTGK